MINCDTKRRIFRFFDKIKTIKEMINNDASIEFISKVTNKSKDEILKIKESMKK